MLDASQARDSISRGSRKDMGKEKHNLNTFALDVFKDGQLHQSIENSCLIKNESHDTNAVLSSEEMECYYMCHDTGVTDYKWCVNCNYYQTLAIQNL